MIFKSNGHKDNLYNTLLSLSRNIFFYKNIKLSDNFNTRIYLMFIHFSIMMIVTKKKQNKFNQKSYDMLFYNIENDLRELGYGDIAVNKKMKEFNKILYDILLKLEFKSDSDLFKINYKLINKYFIELNDPKSEEFTKLNKYFSKFYDFCFEYSMENMLKAAINFKY